MYIKLKIKNYFLNGFSLGLLFYADRSGVADMSRFIKFGFKIFPVVQNLRLIWYKICGYFVVPASKVMIPYQVVAYAQLKMG